MLEGEIGYECLLIAGVPLSPESDLVGHDPVLESPAGGGGSVVGLSRGIYGNDACVRKEMDGEAARGSATPDAWIGHA